MKFGEYALKEGWIVDNVILLEVKEKPISFHLNEELVDPKVEILTPKVL
jgi:hypothetical protein